MYTSSLKYSPLFESASYNLMSLIKGGEPMRSISIPDIISNRLRQAYAGILLDVAGIQVQIHDTSLEDAAYMHVTFSKLLHWMKRIEPKPFSTNMAMRDIQATSTKIIKKLEENLFLMKLIIDGKLGPSDRLPDLLEDYYDGIDMDLKETGVSISWEELKRELDVKYNLA